MRRTTCCEFLGSFRRGIKDGSKSGGKYLLRTSTQSGPSQKESTTCVPFRSAMMDQSAIRACAAARMGKLVKECWTRVTRISASIPRIDDCGKCCSNAHTSAHADYMI
jgi:hypothetical protein